MWAVFSPIIFISPDLISRNPLMPRLTRLPVSFNSTEYLTRIYFKTGFNCIYTQQKGLLVKLYFLIDLQPGSGTSPQSFLLTLLFGFRCRLYTNYFSMSQTVTLSLTESTSPVYVIKMIDLPSF
jgi:hypothetical protein